jgi:hypothetical protein
MRACVRVCGAAPRTRAARAQLPTAHTHTHDTGCVSSLPHPCQNTHTHLSPPPQHTHTHRPHTRPPPHTHSCRA